MNRRARIAFLDDSDSDSDDDRIAAPHPRVHRDPSNPLENLSDGQIRERYRFTRNGVMYVTGLVADDLARPTNRGHALPPLLLVLASDILGHRRLYVSL